MEREINKTIVRRLWNEVWNQANLAVIDEIFDHAYGEHEKAWGARWFAAFADTHFSIEDMVAEGDKVVTRFIVHAVHQGTFMDISATGITIAMSGIWIHRLENGRIVEGPNSGVADWLGLLTQLGATLHPPPVESAST
jgi:predicted ester cyclase